MAVDRTRLAALAAAGDTSAKRASRHEPHKLYAVGCPAWHYRHWPACWLCRRAARRRIIRRSARRNWYSR
ncbi:hypothetical protein LZV00_11855 [Pseudomonas kielensis]|nr:hypothetical protein LZV00_11855 [Pseudomonas kielensis]